ncbi:MAG: protein phosphatase 2C domain-containing protein [Oscillospiraceae bacterium]
MQFCEYSNTGIIRDINQDSLLAVSSGESGLFVVADGMGGHIDGGFASDTVKKACREWWDFSFCKSTDIELSDAVDGIKEAVESANEKLIAYMDGKDGICGTTVAVVFVHKGTYAVMNIGDSRIYMAGRKGVRKISFDHTLNSFEEIKGVDSAEISSKDKLTQAVGAKKQLSWYCATDKLKGDEKFFICTDGVYKQMNEKELFGVIKNYSDDETIKKEVEKQVILNGAPDNFSFIAVNLEKEKNDISKKPLIIVSAIAVALFILLGVISGISVFGGSDNNAQKVMSEKLSLGHKFLLDLEYEKAVAEFNAVIEIEPRNVDAYIGLADAYIGMGDEEKAIEVLMKGYETTGDEAIKAKFDELKNPEETAVETTAPEVTTAEEVTTTVKEVIPLLICDKCIYYSDGSYTLYSYYDDGSCNIKAFDSNGTSIEEDANNSKIISHIDELDSNKVRKKQTFYHDGNIYLEDEFYSDGFFLRKETWYYPNGNIKEVIECDENGVCVKRTQYNPDGTPMT